MEKIALLTGASKGIGKALAYLLAQKGYSLILIARNSAELETLQHDLKMKYQCESKILSIDLAQPDAVDTILRECQKELNNIELLINNAGFGLAKQFDEMPQEELEAMLHVNIVVLTQLTYRLLPYMLAKKHGKILNVASIAAFIPGTYMSVYYASKAYVLSFTQALYEEYKDLGIQVSALCPGMTQTNFLKRSRMIDTPMLSGILPIMSAEKVAKIGFDGLMKNKRVIIPGVLNKMMVVLMWLTPSFISAKIMRLLEKPRLHVKH